MLDLKCNFFAGQIVAYWYLYTIIVLATKYKYNLAFTYTPGQKRQSYKAGNWAILRSVLSWCLDPSFTSRLWRNVVVLIEPFWPQTPVSFGCGVALLVKPSHLSLHITPVPSGPPDFHLAFSFTSANVLCFWFTLTVPVFPKWSLISRFSPV